MSTIEQARNIMLKNVQIQFPKLKNAVNFRGKDQWECGLITEDSEQAKEWMDKLIGKVKGNDPMSATAWTVSLNRKVLTSKGEDNGPVRVVDANKKALTPSELSKIGNGTRANIIMFQGPYDNEFGKGVFNSLTAIQILELVEYEGGMEDMDFDLEGEGAQVWGADEGELF